MANERADYYPDFGPPPGQRGPPPGRGPMRRPPPDESPEDRDERETEEVGEGALVPKSVLGGRELRPGDRIEMEVVHLYDDEVEMKPVSSEPKEPPPPSADDEIDMMAEEGD